MRPVSTFKPVCLEAGSEEIRADLTMYTRQGRLRDADVDMGTTVLADTSGGMFMYGQYGRDPVPFRGY